MKRKQEQGGFLQLIVLIIVVLLIMSYFHITVGEIIDWIINTISNILT